ncbi:hypothetical protein ATERTT37_007893 [Aspergillus terreus]
MLTTAAGINLRHCQIHILAEPSLSEVAVSLSGIQLARHISDEDFSKTPSIPRFYSTEWQPDIHLVTNEFFDSLVNHQEDTDNKWGSECEHFTDLQLAATLISTDALFDLKGLDLTGLEPHYHRFYDLLKHIAADILTNAIPRVPFKLWKKYAEDEHLKEDLYKRVQLLNSDGALLIKVGTRIPAFFRQELDPLHIMFGQDDLMTEYYDDDFKIGTIQEKLSHYLSLFRWNKSNLSVLEVGAGTGSFTSQVLTHLSPQDADRSISEYVFTDLSPGFFEKAKQRLRPWSDIMTYKKLDVGNDPLAQGFELAAFDLIIASNVLHATPNLFDTLQNIHSLLKPGGKPVPDRVEAILILPDSKEPTIVKELRRQMGQLGISLSLHTLSEVSTLDISEKPCLALLGTDMPILSHDNFTAVDELKELLLRCRNLIWISGDSTKEPFFDIATGLIRSMRHAEGKDDRNFVTVSVSDTEPIDKSLSEAISKIFRHQFLSPGLCETKNAEYRIEKGSILTSRVSPNQDATLTIRSGLSLPQAVPTPWNDVHRPQKLVNRQSRGSKLELVWVSDDVQSERLGDNEVDINVKAVSLRWRDSLASSGELPQEGLGGEASGIITRVGSAVRGLHKGDRVMCFGDRRQGREGALRSVLRVNALLVTPIPDDLSLEAAAALLADWTVAIYSLRYIGKLVSRDKILIQAATGSIGQAAIRYAQSVDANIFAAVSNTGEKEYLMREYGLLEDHIFYTPSPFMSNQIKRKVPEGVDIVLLPSSHHSFMRTIGYVAPFGKILEPAKVLTYSQLHEGLQKLRGGNIDNVILQPADDIVPVVPEVSRPSMLDETASYIIIGTLNSLSLKMGMRLAERGAKNLIFLSASSSFQADVGETERMLGSLRTQGCAVHLCSCDFFNETELHHAMTELKQQLPPVKGVIYRPHETQPIKSTESPSNHYQKFRELWLVHQTFPAVDYLVMVSPMKGLDGLCTESETHPTRTFQDTLVHHRVSLGLHSASVDLGDMNDDDALAVIDYATSSRDHASFPSSQIISQFPGPFSSDRQQSVPTYLSDPLFHQLPVSQPRDKSTDSPTERKLSVADLLQSSHDSEHAGEIVSREIRRKLSNLLNVSEDEISSEHNIRDNGVDSLIEMEFQNWIDKELKINLPSEDLISKSISKLSAQVVDGVNNMAKSIVIVSDEQPRPFEAVTPVEERRLIRKIDIHLMPLLTISYAFQLLDKTSLSYAAMLGIKTDLQYSWTSSIFYIGYLVASYPVSIGFVKFPLAKFLSLLMYVSVLPRQKTTTDTRSGAWGIVLTLHAVAHDYPSLMVVRVFLGVCESSQTHGFSLITGMWYTPREQVARHMVWAMGNCVGEAVGSLVSYGLLYYTGNFPQWKILFILFGLLTVLWSTVLWFFLPDSPDDAYFLNEKERTFAALRPKKSQHTTQTKIWKQDQFVETLRDPKSWWFAVFMFNLMVPSGGVTAFSTILVNSFGFNKYTTVLMGLPAVGVQLLSFLAIGFITTTWRRTRLNCIAGLHVNSLLGILLVKLLPEEKKWGRLVGFWLVRAYMPMLPLTLTLLASNTAGFTKKATTGAMLFIGVYLKWENRRRDREQEMHVDAEDKLMVDFQMDRQLEKVDETDRMNRGFRYVL